eukprot:3935352-Rhodomonas_salina.3
MRSRSPAPRRIHKLWQWRGARRIHKLWQWRGARERQPPDALGPAPLPASESHWQFQARAAAATTNSTDIARRIMMHTNGSAAAPDLGERGGRSELFPARRSDFARARPAQQIVMHLARCCVL